MPAAFAVARASNGLVVKIAVGVIATVGETPGVAAWGERAGVGGRLGSTGRGDDAGVAGTVDEIAALVVGVFAGFLNGVTAVVTVGITVAVDVPPAAIVGPGVGTGEDVTGTPLRLMRKELRFPALLTLGAAPLISMTIRDVLRSLANLRRLATLDPVNLIGLSLLRIL